MAKPSELECYRDLETSDDILTAVQKALEEQPLDIEKIKTLRARAVAVRDKLKANIQGEVN